ncbi:MAG: hypothetical protein A2340_13905 [Lentisphaerae bacterium RIFOXYB12_FULL_60_10]|nr:MAG: hypothetical protein A2340_13905 [Lentisphaerae bacterium RIFOXYB12_FULL_60_10]
MCPNKDLPASDKTVMSWDLYRRIIDQAHTFANDIYLHHRGEPLTNPRLFDMIRYAREAGLKTRFHTNGALLTAERADQLLDASPNLVSFSVDGFDKESYESVRVGATFETTVDQIRHLAVRRRERGLKKPYLVVEKIRFQNPARPGDPAAVQALRQQFLSAGIDEVIEKDEYVWAGETPGATLPPRTSSCCTFPWYAMVICADGTVTPCPQDFKARLVMGNAAQQSLRDIWNGPAYRALRHGFRTDVESLPICRDCDRLRRKTVGGIPLQYMATFLVDQLVGYGPLRRRLGTAERS